MWQTAVEKTGGKVPTGKIVKDVVQRIMERTQVLNTYQIGEVCQILVKDNPELKGMGGCWAIVTAINSFSCTVKTWNGEVTVGVQHLKSCEYLSVECEQVGALCDGVPPSVADRIHKLQDREDLEEAARAMLKYLGELKRPYLTDVEEKLLSLIEQEYGMIN